MIVSGGNGQASVIDSGGGWFGAFATPDVVASQQEARSALAITENMKPDVKRIVTIETTGKPVVVLDGQIGPQEPVIEYPGGKNQRFFDFHERENRLDYIKPINPTQPLSEKPANINN